MGEDKKKKFISEKIVGRDITKDKIIKWVLLAIVCGAIFGLVAAFVGKAASKAMDKKAMEASNEYDIEQGGDSYGNEESGLENNIDAHKENSNTNNDSNTNTDTGASAIGNADSITDSNANTNPTSMLNTGDYQNAESISESGTNESKEDGSESSQDQASESDALISEIKEKGLEKALSDNEEFTSFLHHINRNQVAEVEKLVVSVQCISKDKTWFDDMIENTETYGGIIVDVNKNEILVLTKNIILESGNELRVVFSDGTANTALIKAGSVTDNLSIVAVTTEGLGEDFINNVRVAEFSDCDIKNGDKLFAVGAPLSVVPSVDYGYVGYYAKSLQGPDTTMDVIFADIESDPSKGTFLMDAEGRLAGIGITRQETGVEDISSSVAAFETIQSLKEIIGYLLKGKTGIALGIKGVDVSFDMKYSNVPEGMYITDIKKAYPAYMVGIKRGDIITKINGMGIKNVSDYINMLKKIKPGDEVNLTIQRNSANGEYKELEFACVSEPR